MFLDKKSQMGKLQVLSDLLKQLGDAGSSRYEKKPSMVAVSVGDDKPEDEDKGSDEGLEDKLAALSGDSDAKEDDSQSFPGKEGDDDDDSDEGEDALRQLLEHYSRLK